MKRRPFQYFSDSGQPIRQLNCEKCGLGLQASLYQILQILSLTLFEKTPILRALQTSDFENDLVDIGNQLILFDL